MFTTEVGEDTEKKGRAVKGLATESQRHGEGYSPQRSQRTERRMKLGEKQREGDRRREKGAERKEGGSRKKGVMSVGGGCRVGRAGA